MTVFFGLLSFVLLVLLIVVAWRVREAEKSHDKLYDKYWALDIKAFSLEDDKVKLEREINVLRRANRSAAKTWASERQRLWKQARDAERYAKHLQSFHLANEQELQHQLDGAHALIELLMMAVPKGGVITRSFEIQRLFRPLVEKKPLDKNHRIDIF